MAAPIAERLAAPLGVLVVRKLGVPAHPELAMGAVALVGERTETVRLDDILRGVGVSDQDFERVRAAEEGALRQRAAQVDLPPVPVAGRAVWLVDDGLATGATMTVAVQAARAAGAVTVRVAVPVGAGRAVEGLKRVADEVVCPLVPADFRAVGQHYRDFAQTSDDEVAALLRG